MIEDSDAFLADFAVLVKSGSASFSAILDMPDQVIGDGISISTEYSLTAKTKEIEALDLNVGDSLAINDEVFKYRSYRKIDDGTFCTLLIRKA